MGTDSVQRCAKERDRSNLSLEGPDLLFLATLEKLICSLFRKQHASVTGHSVSQALVNKQDSYRASNSCKAKVHIKKATKHRRINLR